MYGIAITFFVVGHKDDGGYFFFFHINSALEKDGITGT